MKKITPLVIIGVGTFGIGPVLALSYGQAPNDIKQPSGHVIGQITTAASTDTGAADPNSHYNATLGRYHTSLPFHVLHVRTIQPST
jgi:hypothetical protein